MNKLPIILLLSLTLLPIIWNGVGLFHYIVEHTHTFCLDETDHDHATADDCLNICHINQSQHQHQVLVQNEYQELKLYLTPKLFFNPLSASPITLTNFSEPSFCDNPLPEDIFHPPIA